MLQLNELLPEAERERYYVIRGEDHEALPDKSRYAILEYYCDNPKCRCKSVVASVVKLNKRGKLVGKPVAAIHYDWSTKKTRCWPQLTDESPQTSLAKGILGVYRQFIHTEAYMSRLKSHYDRVKKAIKQPGEQRGSQQGSAWSQ